MTTRREFVARTGALGLALGMGEWITGCATPAGGLPNVVLVFSDDQGYGDVGVYGAEGFKTPHLDRLAIYHVRTAQARHLITWISSLRTKAGQGSRR